MKKTLGVLIVLVVAGVMIPGSAVAGDVLVYPAKGQSDQQMQKDETECSEWGSQQTGFDPTAEAPPAPDGQQQKTTTSAGKGAAKGAAVGAAVGVISHDHNPWDHDALEGAAKGAVVGGVVGGLRKHHKKKKQKKQQEQEKEYQQYLDALKQYNRAYGTCLGGRGYTVTM
jgi:hypothetical protein